MLGMSSAVDRPNPSTGDATPQPAAPPRLYHVDSADPAGQLIDRSNISPADVDQIGRLMAGLAALRAAEDELNTASQKYMKLGRTDMKALHFMIVAENEGTIVTPGAIAAHLQISSASTTKLLDRLERAGHVARDLHPSDRRALSITVTPETRSAAMETVGKQQARRFFAAAKLSPDERETVIRFLAEMTHDLTLSADT